MEQKNIKQNLLLGLIVILAIWDIFNTDSLRTDVTAYENRIESFQTKIDSAQVVNKQIDGKLAKVDTAVVAITKQINHIDNSIVTIKNQTNEKINSVDRFSHSELELFFSNRYN